MALNIKGPETDQLVRRQGNHPAGLNLGDWFAYALAAARNLRLLFKGDDIARTDLRPAL